VYGIGIELASGLVVQDVERPFVLHALAVWSSRCDRVEGVRNGDHTRAERDLLALQT